MSRNLRRIGRLGEKALSSWASQVGIIANKSDEDETGWDYLLEFPDTDTNENYNFHSPLDKLPSALQCKIQVKASDKHKGNRSISLSNWKRMIDDPLPYFILALEFEGQDTCQCAYLIHVGKIYIGKVLERLRKLSSIQKRTLHTRTMVYDYTSSDMLPELNGKTLKNKIEAHIGESMEAYVNEKAHYRGTVGYEEGRYQLSGRISVPKGYEGADFNKALIDLELGLIPHLEMTRGEIRDIRFGVASHAPEEKFESGHLTMDKPDALAKAEIQLSTPDLRRTFSTKADCWIATTHDKTYSKTLIESSFLRFVVDSSRGETNFILTPLQWEKAYMLKELEEFRRFVSFFQDYVGKAVDLKLFIRHPTFPQRILLGEGDITQNSQFEDWLLCEVEKIKSIFDIAKHFHLEDSLELTLSHLMQLNQKWFEMIHWLVIEKPFWTRHHLLMEEGLQSPNAIALRFAFFDIGQYRLIFCIGHFGELEKAEERAEMEAKPNNVEYLLETKEQKLVRTFCLERGESLSFTFEEVCEAIWKEYPELDKFIANMERPDCFALKSL